MVRRPSKTTTDSSWTNCRQIYSPKCEPRRGTSSLLFKVVFGSFVSALGGESEKERLELCPATICSTYASNLPVALEVAVTVVNGFGGAVESRICSCYLSGVFFKLTIDVVSRQTNRQTLITNLVFLFLCRYESILGTGELLEPAISSFQEHLG